MRIEELLGQPMPPKMRAQMHEAITRVVRTMDAVPRGVQKMILINLVDLLLDEVLADVYRAIDSERAAVPQ